MPGLLLAAAAAPRLALCVVPLAVSSLRACRVSTCSVSRARLRHFYHREAAPPLERTQMTTRQLPRAAGVAAKEARECLSPWQKYSRFPTPAVVAPTMALGRLGLALRARAVLTAGRLFVTSPRKRQQPGVQRKKPLWPMRAILLMPHLLRQALEEARWHPSLVALQLISPERRHQRRRRRIWRREPLEMR